MKNIFKITIFILTIFIFSGCSNMVLDKKEYNKVSSIDKNIEEVYIKNNDNKIYGIYAKSKTETDTIVFVVNGVRQNVSSRAKKWIWVTDKGFDYFSFDFRGYGKSDGDFDLNGFKNDVGIALDYVHNRFKNKKIILVGQSMGATFVIDDLATNKRDYVSLLVVDCAFTSFKVVLADVFVKSIIMAPWSIPLYMKDDYIYSKIDSINNIDKIKTPILFLAGDDDMIADSSHTDELFEKSISKNKSYVLVSEAGHVETLDNDEAKYFLLEKMINIDLDNKKHFI